MRRKKVQVSLMRPGFRVGWDPSPVRAGLPSSGAHRGHSVDSGDNPYEPQGPAADNSVWGKGA